MRVRNESRCVSVDIISRIFCLKGKVLRVDVISRIFCLKEKVSIST